MNVATNLEVIKQKINETCHQINRNPEELTIIGVTKYVTIERAEEAISAGIENLGENRNEGFLEKYHAIGKKATWHFIGTLQTRKVREIIDKVDVLHSLDRLSLAKEIEKRAIKRVECFIQVNVSGEESKHGIAIDDVIPFIEELKEYEKVHVVGLMTMAPHIEDKGQIRHVFKQLAVLRDTITNKHYTNAPCTNLSMGMSNDYAIAIEEGATHIRIGSKLVGN